MIPFDLEYHRPTSIREAITLFQTLKKQNKQPLYYSGGTEIITLSRTNELYVDAIVDLKAVPECNTCESRNNLLVFGSALTLTHVQEVNAFPLLSQVASGVANHTARNKITIGGNITGKIFYREAVLPFLLSDSHVILAGESGVRSLPINQVFRRELHLNSSEFLMQILTQQEYAPLPYVHIKRTRDGKIGYPVVTIAAIKIDSLIRVAFSGVCAFPFRSQEMEEILNESGIPLEAKVSESLVHLPGPILNDIEASANYRKFVMNNVLIETFQRLAGI